LQQIVDCGEASLSLSAVGYMDYWTIVFTECIRLRQPGSANKERNLLCYSYTVGLFYCLKVKPIHVSCSSM